jgi:hypothetical protein
MHLAENVVGRYSGSIGRVSIDVTTRCVGTSPSSRVVNAGPSSILFYCPPCRARLPWELTTRWPPG